MGQAVINTIGRFFSKRLASTGQFLDSCRQKPLLRFLSGNAQRLLKRCQSVGRFARQSPQFTTRRVGKVRAERDVPGFEVSPGRTEFAELTKLVAIRQQEFDFQVTVVLVQVCGAVIEVTSFRDVEISPNHAVIGQGRQALALLD
jgi:hypothetical protein